MRLTILLLYLLSVAYTQNVGVGTATPDPSAKLEVESNNSGFLPPRLSTTERDAIASPAEGLLIYNTTTHCFNYWNATKWIEFCADVPSCSPPPSSSPSVTNDPICVGESTTLNASVVAGATYVWEQPDGTTTTGSSISITSATKADSGTYQLRTWLLGCYSDPQTVDLTVLNTPWQRVSDFPGASRVYATTFTMGDSGYVGVGATAWCGGTLRKDLFKYVPSTDTWSAETTYPGNAGSQIFSFGLGDSAYVGGGFSTCGTWWNDVYKYKPGLGWTAQSNFPAGGGTSSTTGRGASFTNLSTGGFGYWGMGEPSSCNSQKDFRRFDPAGTGSWAAMTTPPGGFSGRHFAVAFPIGGTIYVGYGRNIIGCSTSSNLSDLWAYDIAGNSWSMVSAAGGPPAGAQFSYFTDGTYGYAIATSGAVHRFDPAGPSWTSLDCPYPGSSSTFSQGQAFRVGANIYVVNTNNGETWRFTP